MTTFSSAFAPEAQWEHSSGALPHAEHCKPFPINWHHLSVDGWALGCAEDWIKSECNQNGAQTDSEQSLSPLGQCHFLDSALASLLREPRRGFSDKLFLNRFHVFGTTSSSPKVLATHNAGPQAEGRSQQQWELCSTALDFLPLCLDWPQAHSESFTVGCWEMVTGKSAHHTEWWATWWCSTALLCHSAELGARLFHWHMLVKVLEVHAQAALSAQQYHSWLGLLAQVWCSDGAFARAKLVSGASSEGQLKQTLAAHWQRADCGILESCCSAAVAPPSVVAWKALACQGALHTFLGAQPLHATLCCLSQGQHCASCSSLISLFWFCPCCQPHPQSQINEIFYFCPTCTKEGLQTIIAGLSTHSTISKGGRHAAGTQSSSWGQVRGENSATRTAEKERWDEMGKGKRIENHNNYLNLL